MKEQVFAIWKDYLHSVWKITEKSHSTLRAKRVTFTFWVAKSSLKIPKIITLTSFRKLDADGQSLLPDRLFLLRQKLVKDAKMENSKMRHFE